MDMDKHDDAGDGREDAAHSRQEADIAGAEGEADLADPEGQADLAGTEGESDLARSVALAGTFVLGILTSFLLVFTWGAFTDDDPTSSLPREGERLDPETTVTGSTDADVSDGSGSQATTRLSRCIGSTLALQGPLDKARPALDQWAVHVGAMNKLVVGEITLQQATEFWDRTRLGAQRRIAGFREVMGALRRDGVDCPRADLLAPGARALRACANQVAAEVRVLRAAMTSISTWEEHVHHMDMLRMGELSPEDATRMWLSMWRRGVEDLDHYRSAARMAKSQEGCSLANSTG